MIEKEQNIFELTAEITKIGNRAVHKAQEENRDVTIIGENLDSTYLAKLVDKAEKLINRKIRTLVYETGSNYEIEKPKLLIFGDETQTN